MVLEKKASKTSKIVLNTENRMRLLPALRVGVVFLLVLLGVILSQLLNTTFFIVRKYRFAETKFTYISSLRLSHLLQCISIAHAKIMGRFFFYSSWLLQIFTAIVTDQFISSHYMKGSLSYEQLPYSIDS